MSIYFEQESRTFHLSNGKISYIMKILPNDQLGQLYFGKAVTHRNSFDHLLEMVTRSMTACAFEDDDRFSLDHVKQEYPSYGTGDFRHPAVRILQGNGSAITNFTYLSHEVLQGKPALTGLPATYCEADDEAETLRITLRDELIGVRLELLYTLFAGQGVLARSARLVNDGGETVTVDTAMSLCLDLPDSEYEWVQLSGAWSRERHIHVRPLAPGVQSVESIRGTSSHNHNPFVALKRRDTNERQGEVVGCSLVYSGNFLAQAEVDAWGVTRLTMGINPFGFAWKLEPGASFQTPEAVVVYSSDGLNDMSQIFHRLYQKRLARGYWRDRPRPILLNNWEATYFNFDEEKLLHIAETAQKQGIELFVLDDGWFGERNNDRAGLGDWTPNRKRLPDGIAGLAERIEELGMKFGLWFEPEMVNKDSDLYRAHPDWVIRTPGRNMAQGRHQYVLDYSRPEVVDFIFESMAKLLREAKISYIKWDMNRCITEAFSAALPADRQGELFHRYILGVYDLYDRLTTAFPQVLFESCASGGGRFDPGILHYAPQGWASDDSDAAERLKIQYGTTLCYPVSSIGAHVSIVPNHQVFRVTPLKTRANVACFGTFGYELDLNRLTEEELMTVREQVRFMKKYRAVLQYGTFYRLLSPFEGNYTAWMVVSEDKKTAIVGWYKMLNEVNSSFRRVKLCGLESDVQYRVNGQWVHGGDELMNIGLLTSDSSAGECREGQTPSCDFDSKLFVLRAE
ncbi:alpha-galactosidase [Agathobaculum sp. LCP25S3_E8]|uniref:alpha-galactosidase n=1 Tax=Agathobaculum sp. LCP25S3_E8 TaxID=3438735 RepID=UPI003F91E4B6